MFNIVKVILVLTCLVLYSVNCDTTGERKDAERNPRRRVQRTRRPVSELANIPVAVVYEDGNDDKTNNEKFISVKNSDSKNTETNETDDIFVPTPNFQNLMKVNPEDTKRQNEQTETATLKDYSDIEVIFSSRKRNHTNQNIQSVTSKSNSVINSKSLNDHNKSASGNGSNNSNIDENNSKDNNKIKVNENTHQYKTSQSDNDSVNAPSRNNRSKQRVRGKSTNNYNPLENLKDTNVSVNANEKPHSTNKNFDIENDNIQKDINLNRNIAQEVQNKSGDIYNTNDSKHETANTNKTNSNNMKNEEFNNNMNHIKLATHFTTKGDYIPVAVIYDTDTNVITSTQQNSLLTSTTTAPSTNQARRSSQRKRKQQKGFILKSSQVNDDNVEVSTSISNPKTEKKPEILEKRILFGEETQPLPQKEEVEKAHVRTHKNETSPDSEKVAEGNKIKEVPIETRTENNTNVKARREKDPVVPIVNSENILLSHTGEFRYSYEGGDGTKAFSNGELKTFDNDTTGEAVVGGFSYKDKDGKDFSLTYTADENGYRPVGDHLPTPPPIPIAIARALRYLATKTTPEPVTESLEP